jgi:uncharacterized protein
VETGKRNVTEIVRAAYDAVSRADLDAVAEAVAPDVELIDPDLPGGGTFRGPDGIRRFVQQWLDAFDELQIEVERLVPAGEKVVACLHQRGTSTSGVPVEMRDGHVWTIADGGVTRVELYLTHEAALAAAGADT